MDKLANRVEELVGLLADKDRQLMAYERQLAERDATIAQLETRIGELEACLQQTSSNSSKPPSSDSPAARRSRRARPRSKRKRGAQPGHTGHQRRLLPPERVTHLEDCRPAQCRGCGASLRSAVPVAEPLRHQVVELPPVTLEVTEYRRHRLRCPQCGSTTCGTLPRGVPAGMLGPRLLALLALLTGQYRLSRRQAQQLVHDLFEFDIALGTISQAEHNASEALAPAVEALWSYTHHQPVTHIDATTWYEAGQTRSLWTLATAQATVFQITEDATKATVQSLVGTPQGILVSDRARQFGFWAMKHRQVCWAHLIRRFTSFAQRDGPAGPLGEQLLFWSHLMMHTWHRVGAREVSRAAFERLMGSVRVVIEHLLAQGVALDIPGVSGSCKDILHHREALWTFVVTPQVEPTNNHAERELRQFVLWRKTSFGSQSERGSRFAERIMAVVHTLRKQARHVFTYLTAACRAALHGQGPPSLLPATTDSLSTP